MSLFADEMMLYIENLKTTPKKFRTKKYEFRKILGYKINIQKKLHFYTLITNYQKDK